MFFKISIVLLYVYSNLGHNIVSDVGIKFVDLYKDGLWYVMFYAPWCNYCQKLEPIWNRLGSILHSSQVNVVKIDGTKYKELATKFKISAFPTIIFFSNGQPHIFNGLRNIQDLLVFADKISGPPVREIKDEHQFLDIVNIHSDGVFFLFIIGDDLSNHQDFAHSMQKAYQNVAGSLYTITYFYSITQESLPSNYHEILYGDHHLTSEINGPQHPSGVYVFKDGRIYPFTFDQSKDEGVDAVLYTWVRCERFKSYPKLDGSDLLSEASYCNKLVAILGVKVSVKQEVDPDSTNISQLVQFVSLNQRDKYNEKFWFGWTNDKDLWTTITARYPKFPQFIVYSPDDKAYIAPPTFSTQNASLQEIDTFLNDILGNKIRKRGGHGLLFKLYRSIFKAYLTLWEMFAAQPILSSVIFGLPLTVLGWVFWNVYHMTGEDELRTRTAPRKPHQMQDEGNLEEAGLENDSALSDSSWRNTGESSNENSSSPSPHFETGPSGSSSYRKIHRRRNKVE